MTSTFSQILYVRVVRVDNRRALDGGYCDDLIIELCLCALRAFILLTGRDALRLGRRKFDRRAFIEARYPEEAGLIEDR